MPSTMTYKAGELVLVAFPYASGSQVKKRPALVILDTGDADVVLARVTTQAVLTPSDVILKNWRLAGLRAPSTVGLHKLATLEKTLVTARLGSLSRAHSQTISTAIQQTYAAWGEQTA